MFSSEYFLAAMLLTTTPTSTFLEKTVPDSESFRSILIRLALDWEILDPKEIKVILAQPEDFHNDLVMLQERYHDMVDAPLLEECERFPDHQYINELMAFNSRYRDSLKARLELDRIHAEEIRAALQETECLKNIWDTLRDAQCPSHYILVRRKALRNLRNLIGAEAFYLGRMPPHVPVWRFASAWE